MKKLHFLLLAFILIHSISAHVETKQFSEGSELDQSTLIDIDFEPNKIKVFQSFDLQIIMDEHRVSIVSKSSI